MVSPRQEGVRDLGVRIVTADVAALARFYAEVLGREGVGTEHYVEFDFGTGWLALSSQRGAELFQAGAAEPAANRSVILDCEVADVDGERRRLAPLIGAPVMEPTDQPWGNRSMLFRDPDGNLINFYSRTQA